MALHHNYIIHIIVNSQYSSEFICFLHLGVPLLCTMYVERKGCRGVLFPSITNKFRRAGAHNEKEGRGKESATTKHLIKFMFLPTVVMLLNLASTNFVPIFEMPEPMRLLYDPSVGSSPPKPP